MGSVKFVSPTVELRNIILQESHHIQGHEVTVQTWKMQKMAKPGFAAKMAAQYGQRAKPDDGYGPARVASAGKGPRLGPYGSGKGALS